MNTSKYIGYDENERKRKELRQKYGEEDMYKGYSEAFHRLITAVFEGLDECE